MVRTAEKQQEIEEELGSAEEQLDQRDAMLEAHVLTLDTDFKKEKSKRSVLPALLPVFDVASVKHQHGLAASFEAVTFLASVLRISLLRTVATEFAAGARKSVPSQLLALLQQLVAPLRQSLEFGVENSSLVPAGFVPQKTFGWLSTAVSELQGAARRDDKELARMLAQFASAAQETRFVWSNFAADNMLAGRSAIGSASAFSAIFATPIQSTIISSLVHTADAVALSNRHAKRKQLQVLAQHLAAKDQLYASGLLAQPRPALADWLALVSSFGHALSCFEPVFAAADFDHALGFFHQLTCALLAKQSGGVNLSSKGGDVNMLFAALRRCSDPSSLVEPILLPAIQLMTQQSELRRACNEQRRAQSKASSVVRASNSGARRAKRAATCMQGAVARAQQIDRRRA